ncbi:polysaccharide biosynthesis/export family protein [Novosphingobium album (ex Liu et al. 2023)]|uniref:Polysaccharide export protein n=1 Tax=Novosphingobium album (ex Liu et al. 2023) TaxID=3031130 RepID=A0ABT5WTH9_9SPHN|nr:polysaccharide biosynthesis/export family protein [Novosphingobium album (ex Liu et al. 2023)]MDE8653191.1 polysaccharide export protein [Novosphingobium album (ex Liu et al. 2023)]
MTQQGLILVWGQGSERRMWLGQEIGVEILKRIFSSSKASAFLVSCAAMMLLPGCASHNALLEGRATTAEVTQALPAPDPREVGGAMQDVYYLGPADKLTVFVVSLPEMTQTVLVDPAGFISLPIVGQLKAGGRTTDEVREDIRARLAAHVLVNPIVSVGVADTVSQRLAIEGAVQEPGIYPIVGTTSLLRALTLAHGPSNLANERVVAVFREVSGKRMAAVFDVHMIRQGTMEDPPIYGNDLIVVERSRGKQLLRDVIGTVPLIGAFYTIDRISR